MTAAYFFCKLVPPRPDFMLTMTETERATMREHVAYWSGKVTTGSALLFGPVADPAGGYGIGVMRAEGIEAMHALRDDDPAMKAGIGFRYDIAPMPQIVTALK